MSTSSMQRLPLIVRLCNWVGEAVLSLPTLTLLDEQGFELHLVGKRWAQSLFEGHGWTVHVRPAARSDAIAQLRALRAELSQRDASFNLRPNYLLFTSSFSSALEGRLAGLKPIGYRRDGRSILLAHGVPYAAGLHAADDYWRIGSHFAATQRQRPTALGLRPSAAHQAKAAEILRTPAVAQASGFVILCPFSGAADDAGLKRWPAFAELGQVLHQQGLSVVICPGPGEEPQAKSDYPYASIIEGLDLGSYAALSQQALYSVANDSGPGHLAAAAGSRVISVLGPDAADMWLAQGERVTILKPEQGWPSLQDVLQAMPLIQS